MDRQRIEHHLLSNLDNTEELLDYLEWLRVNYLSVATEVVLELLNSPDEKLRAEAIWFVERLRLSSQSAISHLMEATTDQNLYVRANAIVYLAENKLADLREELTAILRNRAVFSQTRSRAAIALASQNIHDVVEDLVDCLNDDDPEVVWNVIYALGILGNPYAIPALEKISISDKRTTQLGLSLSEQAGQSLKKLKQI